MQPGEFAGLLFTLDMFIHFHTGVVTVDNSTASLTMGGREVAQRYIWHGSFIIDFLATVPAWVEVCAPVFQADMLAAHCVRP